MHIALNVGKSEGAYHQDNIRLRTISWRALSFIIILILISNAHCHGQGVNRRAWFVDNILYAKGISTNPDSTVAQKEALADALNLATETIYGAATVVATESEMWSKTSEDVNKLEQHFSEKARRELSPDHEPIPFLIIQSYQEGETYAVLIRVAIEDLRKANQIQLSLSINKEGLSGLKCDSGFSPSTCNSLSSIFHYYLSSSEIYHNPQSKYHIGVSTSSTSLLNENCQLEYVGNLIIQERMEKCSGSVRLDLIFSLLQEEKSVASKKVASLFCRLPKGTGIQIVNGIPMFDDEQADRECINKLVSSTAEHMPNILNLLPNGGIK